MERIVDNVWTKRAVVFCCDIMDASVGLALKMASWSARWCSLGRMATRLGLQRLNRRHADMVASKNPPFNLRERQGEKQQRTVSTSEMPCTTTKSLLL